MFSCMYCIIPPDKEQAEINPNPIQTPIPMKSVHFLALVENAIVNLSVTQQFINEESKPLEVFYSFPVSEDSVVSSLKVHLNDGSILTAKVKDAEKASETYQDALASGNTAVMGRDEEDNKTLIVNIGNLGPGDLVKVELGLSFPLEGDLADWKLEIPKMFLPDDERDVVFSVSVVIHSSEQIKNFSSSFETDWVLSEDKLVLQGDTKIKLLSDFPSKNIWFKYQAEDSNKPKLIYQKYKNKYYGMIAFVPFDQSLKSLDDAEGQGEYIFLLDRSGSMAGTKMKIAKEATVLFLKSLPEDSYFNIVSFGSYFTKMHQNSVKSSSSNIDWSIQQVQTFSAIMEGTNIYSPLEDIFTQPLIEGYSKTLFLITDGEVDCPEFVIDLISFYSGVSRLHSFGIGDSFDKKLIQKSAKAGKGTANFVNDVEEIGGKVISALQKSLVPCVSQLKIGMTGELYPRPEKLGNVYYGERYLQYFETDEISENTILFSYHDDFRKKNEECLIGNLKMIEGDFLFKLWAKFRIEHLYENFYVNKNEIKRLSIEAGVPCGLTSFICFKENDEPVIGELESVQVKTRTDKSNNIEMPIPRGLHLPVIPLPPPGLPLPPPGLNLPPPGLSLPPPGLNLSPPGLNLSPPGLNLSPPGLNLSPPGLNLSPPGLPLPPTGLPLSPTDSPIPPLGLHLPPPGPGLHLPPPGPGLPSPPPCLPSPPGLHLPPPGIPYPYSSLPYPYSGLAYPYSGLPYPSLGLPHPYSGLPYPYSGLPYPYSVLPYPYSVLPYPYSGLPYPYSGLPYPYTGLPYPYSGLPLPSNIGMPAIGMPAMGGPKIPVNRSGAFEMGGPGMGGIGMGGPGMGGPGMGGPGMGGIGMGGPGMGGPGMGGIGMGGPGMGTPGIGTPEMGTPGMGGIGMGMQGMGRIGMAGNGIQEPKTNGMGEMQGIGRHGMGEMQEMEGLRMGEIQGMVGNGMQGIGRGREAVAIGGPALPGYQPSLENSYSQNVSSMPTPTTFSTHIPGLQTLSAPHFPGSQRLSELPDQTTNSVPKTLDYMDIISSQSSKGFWIYDDFILLISGLSEIPQDFLNCSERNNVCCTILVLLILEKTYEEKQSEWILVMRKAVRWLKTLDIEYQEIKESFQRFI